MNYQKQIALINLGDNGDLEIYQTLHGTVISMAGSVIWQSWTATVQNPPEEQGDPAPEPVRDERGELRTDVVVIFQKHTAELGTVRLEAWPEGLAYWVSGNVVWKSWQDLPSRDDVIRDALGALAPVPAIDPEKPFGDSYPGASSAPNPGDDNV